MLIDFSRKKKLVAYKEKPSKKKETKKKTPERAIRVEEIDALIIKTAGLLTEETSLFGDIPLENAEIAVVVDPCTKSRRSTVSLYDQYIK